MINSGSQPSVMFFQLLRFFMDPTVDNRCIFFGQDCSDGCISFILTEILPHYNQWRYDKLGDRDIIANLSLKAVLQNSSSSSRLNLMASDPGIRIR